MDAAVQTSALIYHDASASSSGFKKTEIGYVPHDWQVLPLSRIVSMTSGEAITSKNINSHSAIPCYGGNGLRGYTSRFTHHGNYTLIGRQGALCGNVTRATGKFFASEHAIVVTALSGTSPNWVPYVLEAMNLNRYSESSAQPGLSVAKLLMLSVAFPPDISEQLAIAEALRDADALIESLEQLIAKKRAIKQGAMHDLLSGRRRLPGFSGDWTFQQLGNLLLSPPAYGINAPAAPYDTRHPAYIRITDITEGGRFDPASRASVTHPAAELYRLKPGDLVLARTGASTGKSYLYRASDGDLVFAGFLIRISPDPERLSPQYIKLQFETANYWNWVRMNSMRSGQPGINGRQYASMSVSLPPTRAEQDAIAEVLTDMDAELEALELRLQKARQIKQGMMQELLTGRVRLV